MTPLEWFKTIMSALVVLIVAASLAVLGLCIIVIFSAGRTGWGIALLGVFAVFVYLTVIWARRP